LKTARADKGERLRFPGVRAPAPLLSADAEGQLSPRQVDLLDELEERILHGGLAELTMAEIAAQSGCSLRTLYGIAPSKDELLLTIVDRRLRRIGRAAIEALDASMSSIDALRAYLKAANEAVQPESVAMSADFKKVAGAIRLFSAHEAYITAITQSLLDRAVSGGEIAAVDTAAVAHVLGSLGREFSQPEVADTVHDSPKETADAVTELILRGLLSRSS